VALSPGARRALASPGVVVAGLLAFLATQYAAAFRVPFINDDFVFLDKTRASGFLALWRLENLSFHWYRPWSRELHYWTLQRLFGARETPFHVASFALWLAVMIAFWALVRRLSGNMTAAVATAGAASLAAWGVPLSWIASVQELWMLLFALLTLHAWVAGRRHLATVTLALALLSKETAAVLAPLLVLHAWILEGRRPSDALRRALPPIVVTAVWALVHPVLGGRLWHPFSSPLEPGVATPGVLALLRAIPVTINLDSLPRPEHGWAAALAMGVVGAVTLGAIVAIGLVATDSREPANERQRIAFGAAWAALGWAPLLMPSLGWHAYYALLGCFGAWLALGTVLARRPWAAVMLVMALALIRPARADTPSLDWGSEWYQRRAAEFIRVMRAQMVESHPRLPANARLFFVRVPSNVGFIAGDGPALRVWYGDPTLRAAYYSSYRPRAATAPAGPDLFFRYDSTSGWVEIVPGAEDVERARRANPRWETDHGTLATTLARAGDWPLAALEYTKLAQASPARVDYAYDAGVCFESTGDSTAAAQWYARAASLPGADDEARLTAKRFAHHLRPHR
jgi:dolichyl-phosphate-mannose-protein mannosyltransferase